MRRFLAALVLLTSLACSDGPTSAKEAGVNGHYFLRTINGTRIPYTMTDGSTTVTIGTSVLDIAEWGVWTEAYTYSVDGHPQNNSDGGRVIIEGTSITLLSGGNAEAYRGTFSGKTLTLNRGSMVYVFER